jgi:hypothetical protein
VHGSLNADDRICADRTDGVSVGTVVVAAESTPGEEVVAAGQGSPSAAAVPRMVKKPDLRGDLDLRGLTVVIVNNAPKDVATAKRTGANGR